MIERLLRTEPTEQAVAEPVDPPGGPAGELRRALAAAVRAIDELAVPGAELTDRQRAELAAARTSLEELGTVADRFPAP